MSKGYQGKSESFASGGPALGRTKDFMKTPDRFRDAQFKKQPETADVFGKGISEANPKAKDKSLPAVKPKC